MLYIHFGMNDYSDQKRNQPPLAVRYEMVDGRKRQTAMYTRYHSMLKRCYYPKDALYHRYGLRGIHVCDEWRGRFGYDQFVADMGSCPDGMSLDRINNDGNYCKENCRWTSRDVQNRNTARNRMVTIDGVTKCLAEWEEVSGVDQHTIAKRLRNGWPAKDAVFSGNSHSGVQRRRKHLLPAQEGVSTPWARNSYGFDPEGQFKKENGPDHVPELQGPWLQIGTREKLLFVDGVCKPFGLWLQETDVPRNVVRDRLSRGWSDKDALFTPALGIGKKRPGIRLVSKV